MDDTPGERKAVLRRNILARRNALEIDDRLDWDQQIAAHALGLDIWSDGPVSAYWPIRSEADPRPILEGLGDRDIPMSLPAIVDGDLVFRSWRPWEPVVPGGFGTLAPLASAAHVSPRILLVPLVAFDSRGHRIGYGKGYFDRALATLTRHLGLAPVTIGIAYGMQRVEEVPDEPHDLALDLIITEKGVCGTRHPAARG